MKTHSLFLILLFVLFAGCKTQQDMVAVEQKNAKKQAAFDKAVAALNDGHFTILADYVTIKNSPPIYVSPTTNFVTRDGNKATIQLAISTFRSGPNGIGGITLDGTVSNVEMKTDKKGNISYKMSVLGTGLSATINIQMYNGSNSCITTVYPNFSSTRLVFNGSLFSIEDAFTYKGMTL